MRDYLDAVLAEHEGPAVFLVQYSSVAAESARTLVGEVVKLANRGIAAINPRLARHGLLLTPAEPQAAPDPLQCRVRVGLRRKGVRRRLPELRFAVSPRALQLGEIVASIGPASRLIGTRHPAELAAGVERALVDLVDAGLR